jgi:histidinol dehydrogenase
MKIEDIRDLQIDGIGPYFRRESPVFPDDVKHRVVEIIEAVRKRGNGALIDFTERYDGVRLSASQLAVSVEDLKKASFGVGDDFLEAVSTAIDRVRRFHERSVPKDWSFVDEYGNTLGQKYTVIEKVGVYIPGGTAVYPSSVVMTVVPAAVAGVRDFTVMSPPGSFLPPSVLAATLGTIETVFGITCRVFRVGGVQGIAALGFGTESVDRVDKIVGPGNIWVACAKKELYGTVAVDMIAGPSEVLVVADGTVDPKRTAIDLLAQAEHDERARPLCIVFSMEVASSIRRWVTRLTREAERKDMIERSIQAHGRIWIVADEQCALAAVNEIAPEHLELHTADPGKLLLGIRNAGAIFMGGDTAEAFGDYIAGPSHVLPTGGSARFFSPLSAASFMKYSSIVQMSKKGVEALGPSARTIARLEGLFSHGRSIDFRE